MERRESYDRRNDFRINLHKVIQLCWDSNLQPLDLKSDRILSALWSLAKLFSCSTQLSMEFLLLINLKLPTIANSVLLNEAEHEIFSANKYEDANYSYLLAEKISCSAELSMKKVL